MEIEREDFQILPFVLQLCTYSKTKRPKSQGLWKLNMFSERGFQVK